MSISPDYIYQCFLKYPVVSTDTRQIQPGSVYFALRGASFNGNTFAEQALQLGAAYAVIDEPEFAVNDHCLLVNDVLKTLQELACLHRKQFAIPVVAITGTNGKTTTKELIHAVLAKKFRTLATTGNLNNHIGVPMTLLRLNPETEIAIVEMGANHPGEIDFLCKIAQPVYGIITNIGKAHLEGFGNLEGVVRTKTELYHYIQEHGGKLFVHWNDELLMGHSSTTGRITYGSGPADLSAEKITANPYIALDLVFQDHGRYHVESHLYGKYNVSNMLAAACIGQYFGVGPELVKEALENFRPDNNRSQVIRTSKNMLIMDAYNANPVSMAAALNAFAGTTYDHKTVILGDMLELGDETDAEHDRILDLVDQCPFQQVFLVGPVFTRLNTRRENICFQDSDLARMWLEHHPPENSAILIKGSHGIKLEKVIGCL
jgi:UDP-N-acetylmuramoyl-tripeptide--D-alanyl-D-alanine ligase